MCIFLFYLYAQLISITPDPIPLNSGCISADQYKRHYFVLFVLPVFAACWWNELNFLQSSFSASDTSTSLQQKKSLPVELQRNLCSCVLALMRCVYLQDRVLRRGTRTMEEPRPQNQVIQITVISANTWITDRVITELSPSNHWVITRVIAD